GIIALAGMGVPRLIRLNDKRAWITYGCLFAVITVFLLRYVAGAPVFGPLEWIMSFIKETLGLNMRELCRNAQGSVK
ncbi:MAG: hypothetical protein LBH66_06180, partial [Oscillospiraceae bacterium]|nr:hypothetical protein [Oscillospiraceae bacterium]